MKKILVADLDRVSVAWAAGVIEGEGYIQAARRKDRSAHEPNDGYVLIKVRVVMSDCDVLEKLRDVFGVGRVTPYRNTQGLGKKQLYRWDAASRVAVTLVCDAIYPWMGERRRAQIDRLRALLAAYPPVSGSERARRTWLTRHTNAARAAA